VGGECRSRLLETDLERARECIAKALSTMEGFEVPLAAWRVHATAADLYLGTENSKLAEHHRELSRTIILKLADSWRQKSHFGRLFCRRRPSPEFSVALRRWAEEVPDCPTCADGEHYTVAAVEYFLSCDPSTSEPHRTVSRKHRPDRSLRRSIEVEFYFFFLMASMLTRLLTEPR
jgi:hypothetical protein